MIKVEYTGSYPTTCMGKLVIYRNDEEIYNSGEYSFHSTGNVWFDEDWYEHVEEGQLKWKKDDKKDYQKWLEKQSDKEEIFKKVKEELEKVPVCCGGCV